MILRWQVRLLWIGFGLAVAVATGIVFRFGPVPGVATLLGAVLILRLVHAYLLRRFQRRLDAALEARNLPALKEELESMLTQTRDQPQLRVQVEALLARIDSVTERGP